MKLHTDHIHAALHKSPDESLICEQFATHLYRPDSGLTGNAAVCFFDPRYPSGGAVADLQVSNADTVDVATPGTEVVYEIGILNKGPSPAPAVKILDTLPLALVGCSWTCTASEGSLCTAAGNGNIDDVVDLQPSGWVDYLLSCQTAAVAGTPPRA